MAKLQSCVRLLSLLSFTICYAVPQNGRDAVETTLEFEYPLYSCEEQNVTAVLSVEAAAQTSTRPILSLTAVLDTSGSMGDGDKLRLIQGTVKYVVERLARELEPHKFGSIRFSDAASELTPLQTLTDDLVTQVQGSVNDTVAAGRTDLLEGISMGMQQQTDDAVGNYIRAVFVFTDGQPTRGVRDSDAILAEVQRLVDVSEGTVLIYTFGLGEDLEYDLLKGIAEIGGGVLYIISEENDIPGAFGAALGGLLTEVALKLQFVLTPTGDAEIVDVRSGGTLERDGDQVELTLGDLFLEERRDVVIEMRLNGTCEEGSGLQVQEKFKDAITFRNVSRRAARETIERVSQVPTVRTEVTTVRVQVARYEIAHTLEIAATHLGAGEVDTCVLIIEEAETYVSEGGFTQVPYMTAVRKDMKTVREEIEVAQTVTVEIRAKLGGLIDAIKEQRTGLTDTETFETVDVTTTLAKLETSEEASLEVLQEEAVSVFPMEVKQAVSDAVEQEGYDEIEVVLTVSSPDLRRMQPPLSVTSVLDRSGSMDGQAFELLIQTQKHMIDWLLSQRTAEIALGVILFSGVVETLQPLQNITDIDVDQLKARLDQEIADGSTELGLALDLGVEQQLENPNCAGSQAVFVLTDGVPSSGRDQIVSDLEEKLDRAMYPISVYAFGLGQFDAELLKEIADVGQGQRYILTDETDIASSFGDAAGGLLSVAAKDIQLDVRTSNASIELVSVFPKTGIRRKRTTTFSFVDMFRDESRDVLLTLHVPKDVEVRTLLELNVSYTDVLTCERVQSHVIEIQRRKTAAKTTRRLLERQVVEILTGAAEQCADQSQITLTIEEISRATDLVALSDLRGAYKTDLQTDLIELRRTFQGVSSGDYELDEACLQLEALKDLLETQRTKGTGETVFRAEKYYDTAAREETRTEFQKTVTRVPVRPARDIFRESFVQAPEEISSVQQNMTLNLKLRTENEPFIPIPTTVVFLVDSSENVTGVEMRFMKKMVNLTWTSFSESVAFATSYLSIVAYGDQASVVLDRTQFSRITEKDIDDVFSELKPRRKGNFRDAWETGFGILSDVIEQHDLIMVPFFSHELDGSRSREDSRAFETLADDLEFPLTVVPVALKKDASIKYFDRFPPWVQSQVTHAKCPSCADAAFKRLEPVLKSVAAKRVRIDVHPNTNVTLLEIEGSVLTDSGFYLISDLSFGEEKIVPMHFMVHEHMHSQILFTLSFDYYDMRSFFTWTKSSAPFVVLRVDPYILAKRIAVRDSTKQALTTVSEAVRTEDYEEALLVTSRQIAVIIRSESEDDVVQDIRAKLTTLMRKIHGVIDGDDSKEELLKSIRTTRKRVTVIAYVVYPQGAVEEPILSIPPVEKPILNLRTSSPSVVSEKDESITVEVVVEAPRTSGQPFDAHATIIVDATVGTEVDTAVELAEALLGLLANRRGRRSVEILLWNASLDTLYKSSNFTRARLEPALKRLEGITAAGDLHYSVVLRGGIESALAKNATLSTLFWIVTSKIPADEDTETLLSSAETLLTQGASPLTVFTFGSGLDRRTHTVLEEITRLSGGRAFRLKPQGISERQQAARLRDAARSAVLWVDTTFCKNVALRFKALRGAIANVSVSSNVTDIIVLDDAVLLTSLRYDQALRVEVTLRLPTPPSRRTSRSLKIANVDAEPLMENELEYINLPYREKEDLQGDTVSVETVDERTYNRKVLLDDLLHEVEDMTLNQLASNDLEEAQISTTQAKVLASNSGIRHRPEVSGDISKYGRVERRLERFAGDKQRFDALQEAAVTLGEIELDKLDLSAFNFQLHVNHTPLSAAESALEYHPVIAVETPVVEAEELSASRNLTVVAVFDAVEYSTVVDSEVPLLSMQTETASTILRRLVSEDGFGVQLTAIGSRRNDTSVLTPLKLDPDSLFEVDRYLSYINATGQPTDLYSSLQRGLFELDSVTDNSDRVVLLFSAASSVCLVQDPRYDALLAPYITNPVTPVKVMTYVVGPSEPSKTDPISELTGGTRYYLETLDEMDAATSASVEDFKNVLLRGMRLSVTSTSWQKSPLDVVARGRRIESFSNYTVALADMKPNQIQSVELSVALDAWTGNADLFDYSLSYFDPFNNRWVATPVNTLRLQRAPDEIIQERDRLGAVTVEALNGAVLALAEGRIEDAADVIHLALIELDQSPYQDDSLIAEYIIYLSQVYEHILELLEEEQPDVTPVVLDLLANGAELTVDESSGFYSSNSSNVGAKNFHVALILISALVALFLELV